MSDKHAHGQNICAFTVWQCQSVSFAIQFTPAMARSNKINRNTLRCQRPRNSPVTDHNRSLLLHSRLVNQITIFPKRPGGIS